MRKGRVNAVTNTPGANHKERGSKCLDSKMGNKQNKSNKSKDNVGDRKARGDRSNETSQQLDEEAEHFIQLTLIREYPSGSHEQTSMDVPSNMLVTDFLSDLQMRFSIPAERILIYRHNGNVPLPNRKTLSHQGITDGDILRIRDGSLN
ncbi:unnamed protein product [Lymnaea stagnalis]|uniref:Ubiquitin-like domain-containing protein n=1 Tax=Lymnaea stagnalis TaxID=6523 RepID=A0AAV2H6J6_LYMST